MATSRTPGEVEAHWKQVGKHLGSDVVFVLTKLPSFDRNRLLKKRVPFIVPYRQMFLPPVMLDLREVHGTARKQAAALSMPAQLLLLHHLQKRMEQPQPSSDWARILGYSKSSVTRAHQDLVAAGLVKATRGKSTVQFIADRRELWEQAQTFLQNPIQREGYYLLPAGRPPFLEAGFSALARHTNLSADPHTIFATWRPVLKTQRGVEPVRYKDEGTVMIQCWGYSPMLLTEDNQTVNRLSLYLSLRDSSDERVQLALEKLLEDIKW